MCEKKHNREVEIEAVIGRWIKLVTPLVLVYYFKSRPAFVPIRYGVIGDDGGMITFRRGFESTKSWSFHLDIVAT